MVPELLVTALLLGWLLKGKFGRLADVNIHYGWMIPVPLLLYAASYWCNYAEVFPPLSWPFAVVHVLEFAIFVIIAVANRSIPGVHLVYAGLLINLVAIVANGGYMPVSKDAIAAVVGQENLKEALSGSGIRHTLMDAGTRLRFLCDIIAAHKPFALAPSVYSIGDLVMSVGVLVAVVAIMVNPRYSTSGSRQKA